ncbi:MAG: 50S ribosomal protein L13 [Candidatus Colwellbacteria bacterium RIFCSPHIGHO2_12_FULL_44_17]|uniref:Large ribosomal subunit protein uL13 n=2 Tax=Candidatus Colwelliibacteriota TaxID=1817904 RepID=A0A1G1Z664_9BACT|nr:MAG: 50S ribosomal protein L13 [Candidatus Colwellbacteria bacterium RIFCSPHIGHO2_12_FULL_44_17]OGY60113.1 MAG: 50S ribosomal protein L13 [Candidatus Colwellbacteria bacterium RIFCSPLOWO2_02_FULL_44_20b]
MARRDQLSNLFSNSMEYVLDAKNQHLGRFASKIAHLLQGKDTPSYEPRLLGSNRVIVTNVSKIILTGKKAEQKVYYRHTQYVGHLKKTTYEQAFQKDPTWVLRHAVRRMLPQNQLRDKRLKMLQLER